MELNLWFILKKNRIVVKLVAVGLNNQTWINSEGETHFCPLFMWSQTYHSRNNLMEFQPVLWHCFSNLKWTQVGPPEEKHVFSRKHVSFFKKLNNPSQDYFRSEKWHRRELKLFLLCRHIWIGHPAAEYWGDSATYIWLLHSRVGTAGRTSIFSATWWRDISSCAKENRGCP